MAASYGFTHFSGARVIVDRTKQVLVAELDDMAKWSEFVAMSAEERAALMPTRGEHGIAVLPDRAQWKPTVFTSVAKARVSSTFTPLVALSVKAKHGDDRLYAAMEVVSHDGAGEVDGLFQILEEVRLALPLASSMRGLLDAAKHFADGVPIADGPSTIRARRWRGDFLRDAKRSTPIGFYAEDDALDRIFRHDRLLQQELSDEADVGMLRDALGRRKPLLDSYRRCLAIAMTMTGRFVTAAVDVVDARKWSILPPSDSHEGRLIKALFAGRSIPDGFELATELVERIRDGRLQTDPAGDGFYAHQFHAIAALLQPDTDGLRTGPRYRKELEDAFRALFTLNRETHTKQLEMPAAGGAVPLVVAPKITVEPVPEFYARMASAYRFLRDGLVNVIGEPALRSVLVEGTSAYDALVDMELLFRGAEVTSREELGRPLAPSFENDAARSRFSAWQRTCSADQDLADDLRVAVPVYFDEERRTTRICVTLGVTTKSLEFSFEERPDVRVFATTDDPSAHVSYRSTTHTILSPITIECDVRVIPTRKQLRAICDEHREAVAIKRALEALGGGRENL